MKNKEMYISNLPRVSIITPSYNQGQFIEETILSVLNQTYPNIEYIIVDGGSTDNTLEVIKKYENNPKFKWISEIDEGQYDAINKGFHMARGSILGYINSDDFYLPNAVSKVVNCFNKHEDVEVVYGEWYPIDEEGLVIPSWRPNVRSFDLERLRCYDYINPSAAFIRASLIGEGFLIDNSISHLGDWEWYLRMATAGKKFYFLNEKLCYFCIHPASKTITLSRQKCREQRLIISKRYNIPYWKMKVWYDFIGEWRGRFSCLHYLLSNHKFSEIFQGSIRFPFRFLKEFISYFVG